ncbi:hypothetical protein GCM10010406_21270 [Streptomyces thermolineatus]|uniref:Uncharacterized protein n=1 Tax=Streptomyces thermolineatus TaxID=44033 RepID=A0ABP5YRA8_9ACTN
MPTTTALDRLAAGLDQLLARAELDALGEWWALEAPAHPLLTKTTAQLVAEALHADPATGPADAVPVPDLPGRWRAALPHWIHHHLGTRPRLAIPAHHHLLLTSRALERTGWAATGARDRTLTGRRCILGAQHLLHSLGYGDLATIETAGRHIQRALAEMRQGDQPYWVWNDKPHVHPGLVHHVLGQAARLAQGD